MTAKAAREMSLADAARRLGVGYWRAREWLLTGALKGQVVDAHYLVNRASVERLRTQLQQQREVRATAGDELAG